MATRNYKGQQTLSYTHYVLNIYMPEGNESCKYCPCIKYDKDKDAKVCKWTGELLEFSGSDIGLRCPLIKIQEENENADSN